MDIFKRDTLAIITRPVDSKRHGVVVDSQCSTRIIGRVTLSRDLLMGVSEIDRAFELDVGIGAKGDELTDVAEIQQGVELQSGSVRAETCDGRRLSGFDDTTLHQAQVGIVNVGLDDARRSR